MVNAIFHWYGAICNASKKRSLFGGICLKPALRAIFTLPFLCSRLFSFHCRACALWPLFGQVGDISVLPTPLPGLYVQGKSVRQMRLPGVEEFEQLSES